MSRVIREVSNQVDPNWAVQPQNMASCLKYQIEEVEGMYCLCSENKGADQMRSNCPADLRHF